MLKRIKIRGKLLLMLLAPLLALTFFSFTGVSDRTEQAADGSREARVAEFVETSGDLSTALQIERFNTQLAGRLMLLTAETRPDELATDDALAAWLGSTHTVRNDLESPDLQALLAETRIDLIDVIDADRRVDLTAVELAGELDRLAGSLNQIIQGANNEATSVALFRSLDAARGLIAIQNELVAIANVGDAAIADGQVPTSAPIVLATAANNITVAFDEVYGTLGASDQAALDQLLTDDMLPRLVASDATENRGGFNPTLEIGRALNLGTVQGSVSWTADNEARVGAVSAILADVLNETESNAAFNASLAEDEATRFFLLALSVAILAFLTAIVVGRSVSQPLIELTSTARRLSSEELPAMVESMRTAGRTGTSPMTPIEAKGRDEVAQLSRAFGEIQSVTVEVAEEQGTLLRRGISDIFVNLARRNQSLLDRQIDFIDQLESREENPDQLENLFRLDHLATRMRRNAESLLVLAGAEPTRRRGRPVELADVIRVAVGEIEDFSRIDLAGVESATVAGSVAVDLAHLLSELMENATQFSPPDTLVTVHGARLDNERYEVTLRDHGIGMSAEQLAAANTTLAEPPLIGLELGRSLGFTVVSRLSHRLGVNVRIRSGETGGVVAVLSIPPEMLGLSEGAVTGAHGAPAAVAAPTPIYPTPPPALPTPPPILPTAATAPRPTPMAATAPSATPHPEVAPQPLADQPTSSLPAPPSATTPGGLPSRKPAAAAPTPTPTPGPAPSVQAPVGTAPAAPAPAAPNGATGDLFEMFGAAPTPPAPPANPDADLFAPIDQAASPPAPEPAAPAASPLPTRDPVAAAPTPEPVPAASSVGPVDQGVTSAGLIRRTPKQVAVPDESKYDPSAAPASPAMSAGNRSPEEVRQMLSRYRAGLRKGRDPEPGQSDPDPR